MPGWPKTMLLCCRLGEVHACLLMGGGNERRFRVIDGLEHGLYILPVCSDTIRAVSTAIATPILPISP